LNNYDMRIKEDREKLGGGFGQEEGKVELVRERNMKR